VIPEYLYKNLYADNDNHQLIIVNKKLNKIAVKQKGHYEPILCQDCEDYFNKTFEHPCLEFFNQVPRLVKGDCVKMVHSCPELELLCLAILWRSSQCKDKNWKINLGSHEKKLYNILRNKVDNFQSNYQIWGFILTDNNRTLEGLVSPPQIRKFGAYHFYIFICGSIQFCVNISTHRLRGINSVPLEFSKPLIFRSYTFEKMPSFSHIFS
jgi:hypothetical protein